MQGRRAAVARPIATAGLGPHADDDLLLVDTNGAVAGTLLGGVVTEPELRQVPFLLRRTPRLLGVLATRGPRRPTPIGLSLVRLVAIEAGTIRFAGSTCSMEPRSSMSSRTWRASTGHPVRSATAGSTRSPFADGITPASLEP